MTRWLMVTDEADTVPGFVDAPTPEDAIVAWAGKAFDRAAIFVVAAEHVRRFEPQFPHHTRWHEADELEPDRDRSGSLADRQEAS